MNNNLPADFVYPPGFVQPESVDEIENGLKKLTFPDGFVCYVESQPAEAALIYNEVVVHQEYFQHGLSVAEARCVMDVGANIGMFALEVKRKAPNATVYAFEPIPETFHVLEHAIRALECSDVHLYNVAVGSQDHGEMSFTFFPNMPGNSTSLRSIKDDNKPVMDQIFGKQAADFLYQSEVRTVAVRTLSSVIREQGITSIDYLKIDVEGGEISVLDGIEDVHWSIVKQIAIEAHTAQLREQVSERLAQQGFEVFSDLGVSSPVGVSLVYGRQRH